MEPKTHADYIGRIQERWYQYSHWATPGYGGRDVVRRDVETLRRLGFEPLGSGNVPEGAEVIYAPTSCRKGGPGRRTKYWVGRWVRLPGE